MKKLIIGILCVLLITALAVPAFAAVTASLSASSSTVHRGDTFTVAVSVSGVDACQSGSVEVTYGSAFELVSGEWLMENIDIKYFIAADKEGGFAFSEPQKLSGKIFRLTFKVKSDAKFASDTVSVKLRLSGEDVEMSPVKVTVACKHSYGSWSNASESQHSRKCSICGNTEKASHSYDNACDTSCNDCKATREITHDYSAEWVSDEAGHWHECTVCGDKTDIESHNPGEEAGEYTDQICTDCEYVITPALGHQHKYEETMDSDESGHWLTCTGCQEETEHETHVFDGDCDTVCDTCGYERKITHKETNEWSSDAGSHWQNCTECGEELNRGEHTWDAGVVTVAPTLDSTGTRLYRCTVCLAEKSEVIPAQAKVGGLAWWAWMLIGVGIGAVVTVGIGLLVIIPLTKRGSRGKYSNK